MKRTYVACLASLLPLFACSGATVPLGGAEPSDAGSAASQETGTSTTDSSSPKMPTPPVGVFSFDALATAAVPAGSKVVVIWTVSATSPDYLFAFGQGTASGSDVFVSFSTTPPEEAINAGVLGVGLVGVVDASEVIVEGKITEGQIEKAHFISSDHAVIYRGAMDPPAGAKSWIDAFPKGFSCGRCVDTGTTFDDFAPEDCKDFRLVPAAGAKVCNWT